LQITMKAGEIEVFSNYLSKASGYFEFGMGGSTCLAYRLVQNYVHAIDSDPRWVAGVETELKKISAREVRTMPSFDLWLVDIGKTIEWGIPVENDREKYKKYSLSIRAVDPSRIDFCLVDGRFRVACFLEALSYLSGDAIVAIHDYTDRPQYHLIEAFADRIVSCEGLHLFRRKRAANLDAIRATANFYRGNPE